MTIIRKYSELLDFLSFEDRFEYLKLNGTVGRSTFGFDRYLNQKFYTSYEWRRVRDLVVVRDEGCDLGVRGYEIHSEILVHHMNPITSDAIRHSEEWILDPQFLITTTHRTHNAIHYGDATLLPELITERSPGDTKLW